MDDEIRDVHDLHEKFGLPIGDRGPQLIEIDSLSKRVDFVEEEWKELKEAVEAGNYPKIADALVDLTYVIKGTAVMLGISPECWTDLWNEVHWCNMQKVRDVSPKGDDYHFGLHKPEGWKPPQIEAILESYQEHYK